MFTQAFARVLPRIGRPRLPGKPLLTTVKRARTITSRHLSTPAYRSPGAGTSYSLVPSLLHRPVPARSSHAYQSARPFSFIFRRVVPRVVGGLVKVPLTFIGAGAGVATYANYKINQVTSDFTPDWLVDFAANARGWMSDRSQDLNAADANVSGWFQNIYSAYQNTAATPSVFASGSHPGPDLAGGTGSQGGGSSGEAGGNGEFVPPDPSTYTYYAAMADQDDTDSARRPPSLNDTSNSGRRSDSSGGPPAPRGPGAPEAYPANQAEFARLIKTLIEIQNTLKTVNFEKRPLQLPSIVVIGSQSSGKSSVLEAIVGQHFLPKGSNMVTRRPIELTLVHTPHSTEQYGEFPELGLGKIHDFDQIRKTLTDLNLAVPDSECVSDKPIDLRIYSAQVPDLKLVDLPGYIQIHNRNQPAALKSQIQQLCERYIQAPNIILAVCAADVDLANSEALLASRRADPLGLRTLGVITKMDTVEPETGRGILLNKDYPLQLGYVGVICKPLKQRDHLPDKSSAVARFSSKLTRSSAKGDDTVATISDTITENQYYELHPIYQEQPLKLGVTTLRNTLIAVLERHMIVNLRDIVDAVQTELDETRYQFKVHYSDQRISAESYAMDSLDQLKRRFKEFTTRFGRTEIREEIRRMLEERVMDVCAETYWDEPATKELGTLAPSVLSALPAMYNYYPSAGYPSTPASSRRMGAGDKNGGADAADDGRPLYWQRKLERTQSLLTKSGVGRWSTQLIVDTLLHNLQSMVSAKPFSYHEGARRVVMQFSQEMIRSRYLMAVEQVENTLKPLKYEVDCTDAEWQEARERTISNLSREIDSCGRALRELRDQVGRKKLNDAVRFVKDLAQDAANPAEFNPHSRLAARLRQPMPVSVAAHLWDKTAVPEASAPTSAPAGNSPSPTLSEANSPSPTALASGATDPSTEAQPSSGPTSPRPQVIDLDDAPTSSATPRTIVYSPRLLDKAREAIYLRHRLLTLKYRLAATKIRACRTQSNRVICPEVFLHTLAAKLAHNAVLFIQVELLNEFFFQFPRELDNRLYYGLNKDQIYQFARENPHIVHQLDLADRKAKLEEVMQKLVGIVHEVNQHQQQHPGGASSRFSEGYTSTGNGSGGYYPYPNHTAPPPPSAHSSQHPFTGANDHSSHHYHYPGAYSSTGSRPYPPQ
ncbi:mitochondrial dynamin GTPase Msp1 [Dimargaris cristalligena]|nr:mitochondrial dynamin GTPase Msp1 [Dimargaris cristalligena]